MVSPITHEYTHEERCCCVIWYGESGSARAVKRKFCDKFGQDFIPSDKSIRRWWRIFFESGNLFKRPTNRMMNDLVEFEDMLKKVRANPNPLLLIPPTPKNETKPIIKKMAKGPKLSYAFDDNGKLINIETGGGFVFTTQSDYERLGEQYVEGYLFDAVTKPPYNMRRILLSGQDVSESPRASDPPDESFVFVSPNFDKAATVAVIIHGTGVVRAGQWSRKLIINESLEVGSQLPYIRRCLSQGWGVLVLNTNDNAYVNGKKMASKRLSATPFEHASNAWRRFVDHQSVGDDGEESSRTAVVAPPADRHIIVIAHSYGGAVTMHLLQSDVVNTDQIAAICLTDAMFDENILIGATCAPHRNWVRSTRPLDEDVGDGQGHHVSAGTAEHERTSHAAIDSVFRFIDSRLPPCTPKAEQ